MGQEIVCIPARLGWVLRRSLFSVRQARSSRRHPNTHRGPVAARTRLSTACTPCCFVSDLLGPADGSAASLAGSGAAPKPLQHSSVAQQPSSFRHTSSSIGGADQAVAGLHAVLLASKLLGPADSFAPCLLGLAAPPEPLARLRTAGMPVQEHRTACSYFPVAGNANPSAR